LRHKQATRSGAARTTSGGPFTLYATLPDMKYFDAHCHPQFSMYDADRSEVFARMQEQGVGGLIVGTELASSKGAIALADGEGLFASVGLHPNHAGTEVFDEQIFRELAGNPLVVAIGECGLDYFRPEDVGAVKTKQKEVFTAHIRIAGELRKPLMIHARPSKGTVDAYEDALDLLEEAKHTYPDLQANFHFFVGDVPTASRIVRDGFTCSFTAVLTFTHDYDDVIRSLPLEHILSETDAPYVAPVSKRGQRNEPTAVIDVVATVARIRAEEEGVVREAILANAKRFFGI